MAAKLRLKYPARKAAIVILLGFIDLPELI